MPDDISPEDRERLAYTKFTEWSDRYVEEKLGTWFDSRVKAMHEAAGTNPTTAPTGAPQQPRQAPTTSPRRRSLLEECFSQAFHIG